MGDAVRSSPGTDFPSGVDDSVPGYVLARMAKGVAGQPGLSVKPSQLGHLTVSGNPALRDSPNGFQDSGVGGYLLRLSSTVFD